MLKSFIYITSLYLYYGIENSGKDISLVYGVHPRGLQEMVE